MQGNIKAVSVIISFAIMAGCAESPLIIRQKAAVERTGVFSEYGNGQTVPAGMSLLSISASLKTHGAGYTRIGTSNNPQGKPLYTVLVNIDGQPVEWKIEGKHDAVSLYDGKGKRSRDPEAGNGIRYTLEKKIIISPGRHLVFFSLPGEPYHADFKIIVLKGDDNYLDLKPIYKFLHRPRYIQSFLSGIKDFKAYYNGVCCVSE